MTENSSTSTQNQTLKTHYEHHRSWQPLHQITVFWVNTLRPCHQPPNLFSLCLFMVLWGLVPEVRTRVNRAWAESPQMLRRWRPRGQGSAQALWLLSPTGRRPVRCTGGADRGRPGLLVGVRAAAVSRRANKLEGEWAGRLWLGVLMGMSQHQILWQGARSNADLQSWAPNRLWPFRISL